MNKFILSKLALIILMFLAKNALSQIDYGITVMVARNNFLYDSWMYRDYWDGERKELYVWSKEPQPNVGTGLGGYVRLGFKNLPIGLEANPEIQFLRTKLFHKSKKTFEYSQFDRLYFPLKLYVNVNNNLRLYSGVNYSYAFNFRKLRVQEAICYSSNWGYLCGIDYQILNRITIGANYYNSFNFDFKTPPYKLGFTASGIALKLSYSFSPTTKDK